ncbi:GNAT family N-acetyltransferase [Foetidibacter luteolus]|uniref:GNAT family N-acetyltransferase n=1 Tax=Foetidibacter luteolus TaxID=2608880 RepID=UPI00129A7C03|nr:GNAT family N-acetyltransferase [Foetidibacter luteolus]
MALYWQCKRFNELSPEELYQLMRLRSEVFVVEQNCVFLDADNKDQECYHLCGYAGSQLAAYVRLVPPGLSYAEASIGRVATSPLHRGQGSGRALMEKAIELCTSLYPGQNIRIGAQLYLKKFYMSLKFVQNGEIYLEDGTEHIEMLLSLA